MRRNFARGGSVLALALTAVLAAPFMGGCSDDSEAPKAASSASPSRSTPVEPAPSPTQSQLPATKTIKLSQLKMDEETYIQVADMWVDLQRHAHLALNAVTTQEPSRRFMRVRRQVSGYLVYLPHSMIWEVMPYPGYDNPPKWFGVRASENSRLTKSQRYAPVVLMRPEVNSDVTWTTVPLRNAPERVSIAQMKVGQTAYMQSWALWQDAQHRYRLHDDYVVSFNPATSSYHTSVVQRLPEGYHVSNAMEGYYPPGKVVGDPSDPIVTRVRFRE